MEQKNIAQEKDLSDILFLNRIHQQREYTYHLQRGYAHRISKHYSKNQTI